MNAEIIEENPSTVYPYTHSIFMYDPQTGDNYESGTGKFEFGAVTLFFDHSNKLWLNAAGWIDLQIDTGYRFFRILPSPIFITTSYVLGGSYYWPNAFPRLESMDRFLWFDSPAGVAVLDLESYEWCLMTRFSSPIAEDSDHNIWIVGEGQIYKYRQEP
ncbi:MAG: hypothetical protein FVQ83_14635 [Chloroflexi bacterium]|nr:hypothetical protein [Chloroflexota bacterium]